MLREFPFYLHEYENSAARVGPRCSSVQSSELTEDVESRVVVLREVIVDHLMAPVVLRAIQY